MRTVPTCTRALLFLVPALLAGGCDRLPTPAEGRPALATATRHPILFVHGWHGSSSSWNTMISRFKADGWTDAEIYSWTYNSTIRYYTHNSTGENPPG